MIRYPTRFTTFLQIFWLLFHMYELRISRYETILSSNKQEPVANLFRIHFKI